MFTNFGGIDELQDEFEKALFAANHKYESKPAEPIEDFNNVSSHDVLLSVSFFRSFVSLD